MPQQSTHGTDYHTPTPKVETSCNAHRIHRTLPPDITIPVLPTVCLVMATMITTGDLCVGCRGMDLLNAFYNKTSVYRDRSDHPALDSLTTLSQSAELCMLCKLVAEELSVMPLSRQELSADASPEQDPALKLQAHFEDDDEEEEEYILLAMRRGHMSQFRISTGSGKQDPGS